MLMFWLEFNIYTSDTLLNLYKTNFSINYFHQLFNISINLNLNNKSKYEKSKYNHLLFQIVNFHIK